jgi:uncharacterized protein YrzB (UPF0473 family)
MMLLKRSGRRIVFGGAVLVGLAGAAIAQDEEHFKDAEAGFSVWFPSPPAKEAGTHDIVLSNGKTLTAPAVIYSTQDQANRYTATVADLKGTVADTPGAINLAVETERKHGEIKLNLETSVSNGACGRNLVVADHDGGQSIYNVFFQHDSNHKLYVFRAKSSSAAAAEEGGADALRFQQSVDFIGTAAVKAPVETDDDKKWERYFYYGSRFSMRFPDKPKVTLGHYTTAKGVKVNTVAYTVRQKTGLYRVTIADLWRTPADEEDAIDQAVSLLRKKSKIASEVTVNISGGQCGRDLQFADKNGSSAISTVVFPTVSHWLYLIEAQASSTDLEANKADLARFRRSLRLFWKLDGSGPN